jgi:hypothetical protein
VVRKRGKEMVVKEWDCPKNGVGIVVVVVGAEGGGGGCGGAEEAVPRTTKNMEIGK